MISQKGRWWHERMEGVRKRADGTISEYPNSGIHVNAALRKYPQLLLHHHGHSCAQFMCSYNTIHTEYKFSTRICPFTVHLLDSVPPLPKTRDGWIVLTGRNNRTNSGLVSLTAPLILLSIRT